MNFPKFTVLIPQKNRAEYLEFTLKTCIIQDYPNLDIVISDDCSTDNSVELVERMMKLDPRIKLHSHKHHLGMRKNFEYALGTVTDGYVLVLGGDDGLVPGCISKMHSIIIETGTELLTWIPAGFTYPDVDGGSNVFYYRRRAGKSIKVVKSSDFLTKLASTFNYQVDECPMLFMKSVASMRLINQVKSRTPTNEFYFCATPDGFSGVALASEVESYILCEEPLSIGGSSKKSQGRNYQRSDETSRKEANQFFSDNIHNKMHKLLANQDYSPLITLMSADYLLTVRDLNGPYSFQGDISIDLILKRSFEFISQGLFPHEVLRRELLIIKEIARLHGKDELYNSLLSTTKIKTNTGQEVFGIAITNSIRFDGTQFGIQNIYDAALALPFAYNFTNKFSPKLMFQLIGNTLKIAFNYFKPKNQRLHLNKIDI